MAISRTIDLTASINATGRAVIEVDGWDSAELQLVSPTATATFGTTNDAGGVTGVSDGSSASAQNFIDVQGTNVNSGTAVTSLAASGIVKFSNLGNFFRVMGPGLTVTKALLKLYKIN